MPSLNAFNKLDASTRSALNDRVLFRMKRFLALEAGKWEPTHQHILLVGDRPAPSAPDDPQFHYTPFGAFWNSSLWLNLQLHQIQIPEQELAWVNAADLHGVPHSPDVLHLNWKHIIALGGNAWRWMNKHPPKDFPFPPVRRVKVPHPQAWKRFNSRRPYDLLGLLNVMTT